MAALQVRDIQLLQPYLRLVPLQQDQVLYHCDGAIPFVYFPVEGLVSFRVRSQSGDMVETACIGAEGVVGSALAVGVVTAFDEAVVTFAGSAWRMSSSAFAAACAGSPSLQNAMHRYTARLLMHAQQVAACALCHSLEQRLATWMLRVRDSYGRNSLPISQDSRSQLLGVQRTTISLADKNLQARAVIRLRRGCVDIIDGEGLVRVACECYGVLKRKFGAVPLR